MPRKTCFLIGHHDTPVSVCARLDAAIETHITEYGVTEFIVGHYGAFDRFAADALAEAKQRHPAITLRLLIPYHPSERPMELPEGFDGLIYPEGMETVPRRYAIARADEHMVRRCDCLICYDKYIVGNTHRFVAIAQRRGISVTNLAAP